MDEAGWHGCNLLYELLSVARERMADRQRRLFAVACCERHGRLMADSRSRRAVEVARLHADGLADDDDLRAAEQAASEAYIDLRDSRLSLDSGGIAWTRQAELLAHAALLTASHGIYYAEDAADCVRWALLAANGWRSEQAEEEAQCRLLREIVAPPFGGPRVEPAWLAANDGAVTGLAGLIDRDRAFDLLPILADALEDAGCADERLLTHCREGCGHAPGCWAIDRLLGRATGR